VYSFERSLVVAAVALVAGCGASMPDVKPVRLAEVAASPTLPMVIELREGDRLPLDVAIAGDLVQTEPAPTPPVLVVRRSFYLVLLPSGPPRVSFDGKTLARVDGAFAVGVGVDKQKGPKSSLALTIRARP
jgi:hypothetical protein